MIAPDYNLQTSAAILPRLIMKNKQWPLFILYSVMKWSKIITFLQTILKSIHTQVIKRVDRLGEVI